MDEHFYQLVRSLQDATRPPTPEQLSELSDLGAPQLHVLTEAWPSLSPDRRLHILKELRQLADEHFELTFEAINRMALRDEDARARQVAVENLWESQDDVLVRPLLRLLADDPAVEVRQAVANALGQFVYLGELEKLSQDLVQELEEGLLGSMARDDSQPVRQAVLASLGYSSRAEVAALIQQAYDSGQDGHMSASLRAMGRSANEDWAPQVMAELYHPGPRVRQEAAHAAGELALQKVARELIYLLEDVDQQVRREAIWALGQVGGRLAVAALEALSESTDDPGEAQIIEDALDNLAFLEGTPNLLLFESDNPEESPD
jgi:HEAT repeat protein